MNIINITHPLRTVNKLIAVGLKSGIFLAALLLYNTLYIDTCLAAPFIEENKNSQEFISSDSRENETSKDE
ncbi:hypothetical protein [Candidatus Albibeggiatoa sp. nov. BB20]|uniref:hypothetical protein n=1 Tax=Candidatus Albibeggiatoa sp. nov. BB20 TaxID=3162723 RepID=UPI0033658EE3